MADGQPGSRGAAGRLKPIMLASWNQPALTPDEEELFADCQPKVSLPVAEPRPDDLGLGL